MDNAQPVPEKGEQIGSSSETSLDTGVGLGRPESPQNDETETIADDISKIEPEDLSEQPEQPDLTSEEKRRKKLIEDRLKALTLEGRVPKEIIRILKMEGYKEKITATDCMRVRRQLSSSGLTSKTCGSRGRPRVFRTQDDLDLLFSLLAKGLDHRTIAKKLFVLSNGHISVSPGTVSRSTHYYKKEFEEYLKRNGLERPVKKGQKKPSTSTVEEKSARPTRHLNQASVESSNGESFSGSNSLSNNNDLTISLSIPSRRERYRKRRLSQGVNGETNGVSDEADETFEESNAPSNQWEAALEAISQENPGAPELRHAFLRTQHNNVRSGDLYRQSIADVQQQMVPEMQINLPLGFDDVDNLAPLAINDTLSRLRTLDTLERSFQGDMFEPLWSKAKEESGPASRNIGSPVDEDRQKYVFNTNNE